MGRALSLILWLVLAPAAAWAQGGLATDEAVRRTDQVKVFAEGNDLLAAGSRAIRYGRYDDGIRLTLMGLERRGTPASVRSNALSNLCAAHAAKNEPDLAIAYCEDALEIDDNNWHAYSNRSYAHWLKGMLPEALYDLDAAAAINPNARQIAQIRGMINEAGLVPRVTVEDHQ
jgi:tetratricopeptide (TPR) repeat protein